MSLRRRLSLTVAASVGVALALAATVAFVVTRSELRGQVDDRLREQVGMLPTGGPGEGGPDDGGPPGPPGGPPDAGPRNDFDLPDLEDDPDAGPPIGFRVEDSQGEVIAEQGELPDEVEGDVEAGEPPVLSDAESDGEHLRVIAAPTPDGGSIVLARSLEGVDEALGGLRAVLFLVVIGGAGIAALGARLIAGRLLVPIGRLTDAAEHISETEDLSRRIEVEGDDEVAQLGTRFNAMLERLESSRDELDEAHEEQRRLIADASHELRTPVTSLRTNIEVIAAGGLAADEEERALDAASAQAEELGVLIGDLMDLARGEPAALDFHDVRLDEVVAECVERARRNSPGVAFTLEAETSVVEGASERIARAVNNLLDNAVQHGGGGPVEVAVQAGVVSVRDHGPGVAPADAERLFDRFYRGAESRRRPGSGLGLAIVRQVAEAHGGSVGVREAAGGGAIFELALPPTTNG